ncbi:hypothetical protein CXU13_05060 [Akkermansia muciniphila]|uniref:hypothetical protein n=1 Tax=Akkermansia massiliensis TaxID=2927224 RepID=UPI000C9CB1E3|nr:hypothetical protein [Akkermansia sp. B2-R-115]MCM0686901.1 hypothetical protein [Akkermansia sp. B2-R-115]PNC35780.1 hypothetical protein CXU12_00505 [Akkermansia muciniphila]PNC60079.1 hypothetical protein CXU13_05060 [Akkermansia muciniphila]
MAKAETKQEQAPAVAEGEAKQEAAVKVRILKMGTEIDGWRFVAGALVTVTAKQAAALEADKAAKRVY